MRGFGEYLRAVLREGVVLLLGSGLALVLWICENFLFPKLPPWLAGVALALTLVVAPFWAWRSEHEARLAAEKPPERFAPAASDAEYWFLAAVRRYGLRLGPFPNPDGRGARSYFCLGGMPVDNGRSRWFWDLVGTVQQRGLIRSQDAIYTLTVEGSLTLESRSRSKVPPVQPGELINATTGAAGDFPLT